MFFQVDWHCAFNSILHVQYLQGLLYTVCDLPSWVVLNWWLIYKFQESMTRCGKMFFPDKNKKTHCLKWFIYMIKKYHTLFLFWYFIFLFSKLMLTQKACLKTSDSGANVFYWIQFLSDFMLAMWTVLTPIECIKKLYCASTDTQITCIVISGWKSQISATHVFEMFDNLE